MEKKKFDLKKYADMCEEVTVQGKDGTEVVVRDHIPYEEKLAFAQEMAEMTIMIHDDSCAYDSFEWETIEKYLVAKYYTNIETEEVNPRDVADFLCNNEIGEKIFGAIYNDYQDTYEMAVRMRRSVITTFDDDRSIAKAIRTSFGFLFNGEDVTESLAKAEIMKDTIYNAISALREKEKEDSENVKNGKLNIGGNVINFAKKKKE